MMNIKTKIGLDGRVVIPANYRKQLGIKPGDHVMMLLEDGEIRILTAKQAIKRAQALVRRYVPEGRMLSEELIQERREAAVDD
ncbi:MAG: AbrB/MazE/SpoVT family DNA-binding domain-containing protein [Chloroflexi bacterium]|nr:AbrB/MazE/SpoVT family DNA-binding domain-containing protein [Chloroflexota bacterium]